MSRKERKLIVQIQNAERKLEYLKSKYICEYGYAGLKINEDGSISEKGATP